MLDLNLLPPTQPTHAFNIHRKTESSIMLHGILVDGMVEKIQGNPEFANAEVVRLRAAGRTAEYVFGARTEDEFHQKNQAEKRRLSDRWSDPQK